MGLEKSSSNKQYVSVVDGKFAIRVKPGTEGAVERELTAGAHKGKVVCEQYYQQLSGMIEGVSFKTAEGLGDFIVIDIDGYSLQIQWNSSMRNQIVLSLPNVNYGKPVVLSAFKDKATGRGIVVIYQDGMIVRRAHTKENPNGMPFAGKKVVRGKEEWDFTEVENFSYAIFEKEIARFNQTAGNTEPTIVDDEISF